MVQVSSLSKTTDINGSYYSREKALWGKYTITAKKDGYTTVKKTQYLFYGGKYTVNFSLVPINYPPQTNTVNPNQGAFGVNKPLIFKSAYSDKNGYKNIRYADFLINISATGKNGIYLRYDRSLNKLYLRNENNTGWLGGYVPNTTKTIENSYVKLDCRNTKVSGSNNDLIVDWNVTFKPVFSGTKNIYLYASDITNANSGWNQKGSIVIDNTPPQGTIKINNGAQYTKITSVILTLEARDNPGGSGVDKTRLSFDGNTWQSPEPYVLTKSCTLNPPDGTKKVYVKYIDNAGNESLPAQASITLDTTAPILYWIGEEGYFDDGVNPDRGYAATNFRFRIKCRDTLGKPPVVHRIYIDKNGDDDFSDKGEINDMSPEGSNYARGVIYSYSTTIPYSLGGSIKYYFEFSDGLNLSKGEIPSGFSVESALSGPVVYQTLGISLSPDKWNIGSVDAGEIVNMSTADKIKVINSGDGEENFLLSIAEDGIWEAGNKQDAETFVLNAAFSSNPESIQWNEINHLVTEQPVVSTITRYAGDQSGINVLPQESRDLYLQFKAPMRTKEIGIQLIVLTVSCEVPIEKRERGGE